MRSILALLLLVGCTGASKPTTSPPPPASSPPPTTSKRPPIKCGPTLTCGSDEYCDVQCTCCGMMIPDTAGMNMNGIFTCKPCTGDLCDGNRKVEHPCA